jgi:hypothetical protein
VPKLAEQIVGATRSKLRVLLNEGFFVAYAARIAGWSRVEFHFLCLPGFPGTKHLRVAWFVHSSLPFTLSLTHRRTHNLENVERSRFRAPKAREV